MMKKHEVKGRSRNVPKYTPKTGAANGKGLTHPTPTVEGEEETQSRNVVTTDQQNKLETASACVSSGIVHYVFHLP